MSEREAVEFWPLFLDQTFHAQLGAVSRWADSVPTQKALFSCLHNEQASEDMLRLWLTNAVNRKNVVEIMSSSKDWVKVVAQGSVKVVPRIMRVGRTSWASNYDIVTGLGVPLARVQTVMVAVDEETLSKPMLVPHAELLKANVRDAPSLEVPSVKPRGEEPQLTWRVEVRQSDCDSLGHMNNTVYATLIEDARHVALQSKRFPHFSDAGTRLASIEYIGQPHAGDMLDIAIWWDADAGAWGFEFLVKEEVVAKCILVPWVIPPKSSL